MIQTDMSVLLLPDEENRLESATPEIEEQPEKRTSVEVRDLNIVYFQGECTKFFIIYNTL